MARDSQAKERKKRFTTRETILLISLIVVAMIYVFANFYFLPTLDKINQLKTDNDTLQLEYDTRISLIAQKDELLNQLEESNRLYSEYKSQYFKTTNQEHFIKVLELDLLERNDLDIANLTFNEVQPFVEFNSGEESIVSLYSNVVTFPFEGSYEGLIELIRRLESSKEIIRINSLDILQIDTSAEEDKTVKKYDKLGNLLKTQYQGNITIEFFSIPQEYSYPWNVGLPDYDNADAYEESLFSYDDGGLVPPAKEVVDEDKVNDGENQAEVDDGGNQADVDEDVTHPNTYVVQPGDTLWSISMRFYGTNDYVDQIMFMNNITDTHLFRSGSTIRLPSFLK